MNIQRTLCKCCVFRRFLLNGFMNRVLNKQPISAPDDVKRYFLTPEESGQLCLLSTLLGQNGETFFPKLSDELKLTKFSDIAVRFLSSHGYETVICESEEEARARVSELLPRKNGQSFSLSLIQQAKKISKNFLLRRGIRFRSLFGAWCN